MSKRRQANVDPAEIDKFDALASSWWDPDGTSRALHQINPLRLGWIERQAGGLADKRVLDIGCGGGILAEAMAQRGATVVGIDLAEETLTVAREHAKASGVDVDYRCIDTADLADEQPASFDVVTCMELLEHVPDPAAIVDSCTRLAKPGATLVFASINRNAKSWLLAIIGAEYVLQLLPRGTHEYAKFIRPSELAAWCRAAGLETTAEQGMRYNPISGRFHLGDDVDVNFLFACRRPDDD